MTGLKQTSRRGAYAMRVVPTGILVVALSALCLVAAATPSTTSGYIVSINNTTDTAATAQYFSCTSAETADKVSAIFQFPLAEASGSTTPADISGAVPSNNGTYRGTMTTSTTTPIACSRDTGGAYVLNGTSSYISTSRSYANPTTFSVEVWFKTTAASGMLIGFGNLATGASAQVDRHLYIDTTGKLNFGSNTATLQRLQSPSIVTDGKWHHAAGTMSAATGMRLYLDGALVNSNPSYVTANNITGYWRVGYDSTLGWPNSAIKYYFTGSMRYSAVYSVVLTATQVKNHWAAGQ